jgi:hypothetical protein
MKNKRTLAWLLVTLVTFTLAIFFSIQTAWAEYKCTANNTSYANQALCMGYCSDRTTCVEVTTSAATTNATTTNATTTNATTAGTRVALPTKADTGLSEKTIAEILKNLLTWLLEVIGVIALIGFVVSGIQYIVATGNEKVVESAKKNMTYSLIGITVALASFVIIQALDSMLNAIEF